jgi:hypothetical protein
MRHRFGVPWQALALLSAGASGVGLSLPPLRYLIEQSMAWHMAAQMPLLVMAGMFAAPVAGRYTAAVLGRWNRYGLTGFFAALVIASYWMLPVAMDKAVAQPGADLVKLVTLFAAGLFARAAIDKAPVVLQLFFVVYLVSMLVWLGQFIATTDLRLCNVYPREAQATAGASLVIWGAVVTVVWAWTARSALSDQAPPTESPR